MFITKALKSESSSKLGRVACIVYKTLESELSLMLGRVAWIVLRHWSLNQV